MKLILVAGLGGAIGSTLASVLSYGGNGETHLGMVTYSPKFVKLGLPLDEFDDFLIAGWDLNNFDLFHAVERHACVPQTAHEQVRERLGRVPLRRGLVHNETDIESWIGMESEWIEQIKSEFSITSVVLVNLCPTAPAAPDTLLDWSDLQKIDWNHPAVTVDRMYFRFAIAVGAHFINFTPNFCEIDALTELATSNGLLFSGRDGKTGQTFLKTLVAPAFRDKNLRIDGWFSTNILGNGDGRTLAAASNLSTKVASKRECLSEMLGYVPGGDENCHQVSIHYYPPRGDAKEAWDNIDFSGMFGRGMQLKLNWLGIDSILAAPAILDLIRLTFFAERTSQTGLIDAFGYFFKSPLAARGKSPIHDIDLQLARLINWAIEWNGRLGAGAVDIEMDRDEWGWPKWPQPRQQALDQIKQVFDSGTLAISGEARKACTLEQEFCRNFADFIGMPFGVACSSGSSGLVIAFEAAGIGFGDRVLVPASPWVACASAVMSIGAIPVFCDLESDGLCMSPRHAESLMETGIKAILLVHSHCAIADIPRFAALSRKWAVPLIEDCSQAHGAVFDGSKVGSFGDMSVFSMQQTKVLTSGEGGVVLCRTEERYEILQQLRSDGRTWTIDPLSHGHYLEERGRVQGFNYCLSEIQSGLLLAGLEKLPEENCRRAENALRLNEHLRNTGIRCHFRHNSDYRPAIYEYAFSLPERPSEGIERVARRLSAELRAPVFAFDPPIYRNRLYQPQYCRRFPPDHIEKLVAECAVNLSAVEDRATDTLGIPHRLFLGTEASMTRIRDAILRILS